MTDSGLWREDGWIEVTEKEFGEIIRNWPNRVHDFNAIVEPPIRFYWVDDRFQNMAWGNGADAKILYDYYTNKPRGYFVR